MYLQPQQIEALLRPIDSGRVKRAQGFDHLEQHDIRRWLIRIFGFARWSMRVDDLTFVFEEERTNNDGELTGKFDVLYRATVTLTVCAPDGTTLATYTEVATGDSQNTPRLGAHDLAIKSAVSGALKRAAVNLGDQFGLSLYFSTKDSVVKRTALPVDSGIETPTPQYEDPPVAGEIEPDPEPEPRSTTPPVDTSDLVTKATIALVAASKLPHEERGPVVTRIMVQIGKDKIANAVTKYGVTLSKLGDQAFTAPIGDDA